MVREKFSMTSGQNPEKKCNNQVSENQHSYFFIEEELVPLELRVRQGENVLMISNLTIGKGDVFLGKQLMAGFFSALVHSEKIPEFIVFLNSAVWFATEDSAILEALVSLQNKGVQMLVSDQCLEYHGLKEKHCIGSPSSMFQIVQLVNRAAKVINL